jgi:uncharacterized protein YjdB
MHLDLWFFVSVYPVLPILTIYDNSIVINKFAPKPYKLPKPHPDTATIKATTAEGGRTATCVVTVAADLTITGFLISAEPTVTD